MCVGSSEDCPLTKVEKKTSKRNLKQHEFHQKEKENGVFEIQLNKDTFTFSRSDDQADTPLTGFSISTGGTNSNPCWDGSHGEQTESQEYYPFSS